MRFIQVGVGGFGRCWVHVLARNPKAKVVGMVDISEPALEEACKVGGYDKRICFPTLKDALKAVKADAVVSSTPPRFHRADVVKALKAGLHVISEKPMADSLADCKAMLRAAHQTGGIYCVSQNYRYSPAMHSFHNAIRKAKLGAVGQVKMDFYKGIDFGGGFRHEMEFPLVIDMSIHHFDLLRCITGLDCTAVRGSAWNPSWSNYAGDCSCSLVFECASGARILYNGSWCAKGDFCDWNGNWQVECERGTAVYDKETIRLLSAPDLYAVKKAKTVPITSPKLIGQDQVLADFMKAVETGGRPATDVYDNIRSVMMVFAAVKAMRTGRRIGVLDNDVQEILQSI